MLFDIPYMPIGMRLEDLDSSKNTVMYHDYCVRIEVLVVEGWVLKKQNSKGSLAQRQYKTAWVSIRRICSTIVWISLLGLNVGAQCHLSFLPIIVEARVTLMDLCYSVDSRFHILHIIAFWRLGVFPYSQGSIVPTDCIFRGVQ